MLVRLNPWHKPEETYSFDQLGLRVPAILVSPWVARGVAKIGGQSPVFDHTSLLKYLTEKWDLGPLGLRTPQATSIGVLISDTIRPDEDTIPQIVMPALQPVDPELEDAAFGITEHDKGLLKLATFLKTALWFEPKATVAEVTVETVPRFVVLFSLLFHGMAFVLMWFIRRITSLAFGSDRRPRASFGEPDKIHTDTVSPRNDIAWFTMQRKQQALSTIAKEIKFGGTRGDHAVRTLAAITGRPMHKEARSGAREWLAAHGQR